MNKARITLTCKTREMAIGNTFGATVLSSYGGFWISLAITFIPGGFNIMGALEEADKGSPEMFYNSFAMYLFVCYPFPFPATKTPKDINTNLFLPGLGHLHNDLHISHAQIHRRLLLPLLLR
jgi:hypothetical protein